MRKKQLFTYHHRRKRLAYFGQRSNASLSTLAIQHLFSLDLFKYLIIDLSTPCRLEESLEPNEVNWLFSSLPSNYSILKKYRYYIEYDMLQFNIFKKINFLKFKSQTDVILFRTGYNLIRNLAKNLKHHDKIKSLGYSLDKFDLENVFHDWFKKLFKFKSYLELVYQEMLKKLKPTSQTKLICAQIRIGGNEDKQFVFPNQTIIFWKQIREKLLYNNVYYKLFITSDKSNLC